MIVTAKQITPDTELLASIRDEFPISSQTSDQDKLALLKIRDIFRSWRPYNYVEIGSYLGGSLVPFCRDEHCRHILSIDDRGRNQPDERGATYDYTAVTSRMMLDNLEKQGIRAGRVEVFDGSVSGNLETPHQYDLMMIDGEHTNWACFRDFLHGQKLLAPNAVVMFHDSTLIFNGLKIIREYLSAKKFKFSFFKDAKSDISFLALNDYCDSGLDKLFDVEVSIEDFERRADRFLAMQFMINRTRLPKWLAKRLMRSKAKRSERF